MVACQFGGTGTGHAPFILGFPCETASAVGCAGPACARPPPSAPACRRPIRRPRSPPGWRAPAVPPIRREIAGAMGAQQPPTAGPEKVFLTWRGRPDRWTGPTGGARARAPEGGRWSPSTTASRAGPRWRRRDRSTGTQAPMLGGRDARRSRRRLAPCREARDGLDDDQALLVRPGRVPREGPEPGRRIAPPAGAGGEGPGSQPARGAVRASQRGRIGGAPRPRSRPSAKSKDAWLGETVGRVFTGISLGSILLLAALGLAITYGVMGVINMAHGELLMVGAYAPMRCRPLFRATCPAPLDWYVGRGPRGLLRRRGGRHRARAHGDPLAVRPRRWRPCSPPGAFR